MTATTKPVDVPTIVADMSFSAHYWRDILENRPINITNEVRAYLLKVAELIAANVEYDEAKFCWDQVAGDPIEMLERFQSAEQRRNAALKAIQGENAGGGR